MSNIETLHLKVDSVLTNGLHALYTKDMVLRLYINTIDAFDLYTYTYIRIIVFFLY